MHTISDDTSGRNAVEDGSVVGITAASIDPTSIVIDGIPTSVGGDHETVDGLENRSVSISQEQDNTSGCCCCCGENCFSRKCSSYWNDKRTACRTCATGSREFFEEVVELVGKMELRQRAKRLLRLHTVLDRLPITKWLPKYRLIHLQSDLVAGLAVGVTVIPQGIAGAKIAGLDPQYGLYTAFMGSFMYTLFGSTKDINIGPVTIISLLVGQLCQSPIPGDPTYAIIMSLFVGCIALIMGLFRLGFLVDFISHPVANSFATTSALTIGEGQLKKWLGLTVKLPSNFFGELIGTLANIPNANLYDFLMGLVCIIFLYILKKVKEIKIKNPGNARSKRVLQFFLFTLGLSRYALVIVLSAVASAIFASYNLYPFTANNVTPAGLPPFQVPKFSLGPPLINETYTTSEIFSEIGTGFVILPLVCVLEIVAIGKTIAKRNGYRLDANQDLIALGVGNIMGSFVSAYPTTASFSRSSINSQSGVKTPFGGVFSGTVVIIALLFLPQYFNYIPDAALAAVIISACTDFLDFSLVPKLWRIHKAELFPWLLTFGFGLGFGVEYGIMLGIGWTLFMLLWPWNRPKVQVVSDEMMFAEEVTEKTVDASRVIVLSISHGNLFPSMERLKDKIFKKGGAENSVVLDFARVTFYDYTTIEGMGTVFEDFAKAGSTCIIANLKPDILVAFEKARLKHFHHASSINEAIQQIQALHSMREDTSVNDDSCDSLTTKSSVAAVITECYDEVDDGKINSKF